jgi:hypothetical protein
MYRYSVRQFNFLICRYRYLIYQYISILSANARILDVKSAISALSNICFSCCDSKDETSTGTGTVNLIGAHENNEQDPD